MPNRSGRAYALTTLCPIRGGAAEGETQSFAQLTRSRLQALPLHEHSPMASVPNTYLCRFYILDDVFYQGSPAHDDRIQSNYLVFTSNFHGGLDAYLEGMWDHAEPAVRELWEFCVGFSRVSSRSAFVDYIQRCQVKTTFFFVGSTDDPLTEQLKALYLKQELSRFAFENQGKSPAQLRAGFAEFLRRTQPKQLEPRWVAGSPVGAST